MRASISSRNPTPSIPSRNPLTTSRNPLPKSTPNESNIRVVVRCRGRNEREIKAKSKVVVDTSISKSEIAVKFGQDQSNTKVYSVDNVFGPEVDQVMVFDQVVSPIIEDLFSGMNCTIFAYGQTGTGKTYTMSGDDSIFDNNCAYEAGIIPRVLFKLFNDIELKGYDHSVSCSFVELYNEELKDLLVDEDDSNNKKLRLFDDKSTSVLNGLSENHITSAISGLKVLQSGLRKRQVAATKLNDYSSRSHTIFSINVAIDNDGSGEFITRGKINLVDLAGSENIGKSGAENKRAREAGMINQSLLTLGRVINSLVDKSPHIPYRESKLTRLLQDSLGGRTKTCIIATISPALVNIEETISTLEYASRAKNIKNKPQINNLISKKALLIDYNSEMEKLRLDLVATRKKNGIYLDADNYKEISADRESQKVLLNDQQRKLESVDNQLKFTREQYDSTRQELHSKSKQLQNTLSELSSKEVLLKDTKQELDDKLQRQLEINGLISNSSSEIINQVDNLSSKFDDYDMKQKQITGSFHQTIISLITNECNKLSDTSSFLTDNITNIDSIKDNLLRSTTKSQSHYQQLSLHAEQIKHSIISEIQEGLLEQIKKSMNNFTHLLNNELLQFKSEIQSPLNDMIISFNKTNEFRNNYCTIQNEKLSNLQDEFITGEKLTKVYENGKNHVETLLQKEQLKANEEKEKLLQSISILFDNYTSESNNRMINTVNSATNNLIANSMHQIDGNSKQLNKIVQEIQSNHSNYQDSMNIKDKELNKQLKTVLRTVSSGNDRMELATTQLQTESESAINSGLNSVHNQVQQLDKFLIEAGETTEKHNQAINQGVNDLCKNVEHSFKYLENHLNNLKESIQTNTTDKRWIDELNEIWSLLRKDSNNSMIGIINKLNELKKRMNESKDIEADSQSIPQPSNIENKDTTIDIYSDINSSKRPLDDITNEQNIPSLPVALDIKQGIPRKKSKSEISALAKQDITKPTQISNLKKPIPTSRLRTTTTGRILRRK